MKMMLVMLVTTIAACAPNHAGPVTWPDVTIAAIDGLVAVGICWAIFRAR